MIDWTAFLTGLGTGTLLMALLLIAGYYYDGYVARRNGRH